ncbi:MAG: hypothetical protein ACYTEQ_25810 [Planctomycetota bacterium]|jgi:hypothetical protein
MTRSYHYGLSTKQEDEAKYLALAVMSVQYVRAEEETSVEISEWSDCEAYLKKLRDKKKMEIAENDTHAS